MEPKIIDANSFLDLKMIKLRKVPGITIRDKTLNVDPNELTSEALSKKEGSKIPKQRTSQVLNLI